MTVFEVIVFGHNYIHYRALFDTAPSKQELIEQVEKDNSDGTPDAQRYISQIVQTIHEDTFTIKELTVNQIK